MSDFKIDPTEFESSRVVVTGGTKGAGAAIVRRFAQAGAKVVTAARGAAESLPGVHVIQADLSTIEGSRALAEAAAAELGEVDILVHVLGGSSSPGGGFSALDEDHWRAELDLNLMAAVRLDRALLPRMVERGQGAVIHVSSIQRLMPLHESTTAYAAAKAALTAL